MNYKETHNHNYPNDGTGVAFIKRWGNGQEIVGTFDKDVGFKTESQVYGFSFDVVRYRLLNTLSK